MRDYANNALELYHLRVKRQLPDNMYFISYYMLMRDLVYEELRQDGSCSLLEYLLQNRMRHFDKISFDAMYEALEAASQKKSLPPPRKMNQVPVNRCATEYNLSVLDFEKIERMYISCAEHWKADRTGRQESSFAGRAERPVFPGGAERSGFNSQAEANRILEQARAEAEQIKARARTEAAGITQQANGMLANATAQRERMEAELDRARRELQDLQQKSKFLRQSIQEELEDLRSDTIREAREEAQKQLEGEADQALQRMIGTRFNEYLDRQRHLVTAERPEVLSAREEISRQTALLKEQACTVSNNASAELTRVMEQAMEQMQAVKASFGTELQRWKTDMYKCEYKPLVSCFYSLLVLEKRFERDVAAEADMTSEERLTKLQQHSTTVTGFRARMERAMNAMGLYLFEPQAGETFDAYYHTLDSDDDDEIFCGRRITACAGPGIMRRVNSDEQLVLQRATVLLEEAETTSH